MLLMGPRMDGGPQTYSRRLLSIRKLTIALMAFGISRAFGLPLAVGSHGLVDFKDGFRGFRSIMASLWVEPSSRHQERAWAGKLNWITLPGMQSPRCSSMMPFYTNLWADNYANGFRWLSRDSHSVLVLPGSNGFDGFRWLYRH